MNAGQDCCLNLTVAGLSCSLSSFHLSGKASLLLLNGLPLQLEVEESCLFLQGWQSRHETMRGLAGQGGVEGMLL